MTIKLDTRPSRLTRAQWRRFENVGLRPTLDLDELVLDWVRKGTADLDVFGAITAVEIEQTIEGAPTVSITLRDPNMRLLSERAGRVVDKRALEARLRKRKRGGYNPVAVDEGWEPIYGPSLIGRAVDVTLDGVTFRLTGVSYTSSTGEAVLTFEHRLVFWLRRKEGARRAKRTKVTRAQFVLSLVREVKAARYRFVCPELYVKQPIAKSGTSRGIRKALDLDVRSTSSSSSAARRAVHSNDVPRVLDKVYPRHRIGASAARLSERQVRAAAELAGLSPTDALHAAQIAHGESNFYPGVVQDDPGDGMVGHGLWQMTPNAWGGPSSATYQHMQSLGGIAAMRNPIQAARQMAWMFRQSGNTWRQWYGTRYLNLSSRATKSVLADGVSSDVIGTSEGGASSRTYVKSYQYARNANEDSWQAIQRLAQEVGWRAFVVGNSFYYASEDSLYGHRPRYEIDPDSDAVLDLSFDMDWGKPASECTLQVTLDRWGAPPGSVVLIDGYGPADGRWLVTSTRRNYFEPTAEVTLKQPGPRKLEPAAETVTKTTGDAGELGWTEGEGGASGKAGKLYAECKRISDAGGPYVYGGGHGPALSSLRSGQGLDCSSSTSLALYRAGLMHGNVAQVSGWFASSYGAPGRGEKFTIWANSGHVWIQLHGGAAWRFDTSPYGSGGSGPRLRYRERPTSGFTPRHYPGL